MIKKALLKFKGNIYWLNLSGFYGEGDNDIDVQVLENGKWRNVEKTELDLFDLMEQGVVIGNEKQPKQVVFINNN